jgi:hypothetical protein
LVLAENSRVTFCGTGEATTIMNIVDFTGGCRGLIVLEADAFEPCIPGCMERDLPAGTYMLVVSSPFAVDVACGKKYTLSVQCEAGPVGVEDDVPVALAIGPPFPNPARGQVVFGIDLPRASEVDASIHDLTGRRIATIASGALGEGRHQLRWSGIGADGGPVSSGVFYLRLSAGGETLSRAFVVTR